MRRMKNEKQKITEARFAVIPRWSLAEEIRR